VFVQIANSKMHITRIGLLCLELFDSNSRRNILWVILLGTIAIGYIFRGWMTFQKNFVYFSQCQYDTVITQTHFCFYALITDKTKYQ